MPRSSTSRKRLTQVSSHSRKKTARKSRRSSDKNEYRPVPPSGLKKALNRIWNVTFYVMMIAIVIGAVLFKFDNSPTKSFYGYHFMTVKTNSMAASKKTTFTDGFPAGSFIIVKKVDPASLKVGDIITFFPVPDNTSAYLTHRIIQVDTPIRGEGEDEILGLTTQGDANDGPDFPIERRSVVGKVIWSMKGGGNVIDFIREKYVIVVILVGVLFAFTMTLKYYMSIPTLEPKRRRR